jgi:hypothetical protein
MSDNGWTTNTLGFEWLKHFNKHIKDHIKGGYRLLIPNGHESHDSLKFWELCKENNIIILYMPPLSFHLLQSLNVGYFEPLKKGYGKQVEDMMRNHINHITKLEFLPAFKAAFFEAITRDNIYGSFRGTGLVPYGLKAVNSQLET